MYKTWNNLFLFIKLFYIILFCSLHGVSCKNLNFTIHATNHSVKFSKIAVIFEPMIKFGCHSKGGGDKIKFWLLYHQNLGIFWGVWLFQKKILFRNTKSFPYSARLGRFSHRVAMFLCLSVVLCHWVQFFSRPLIGPKVTWTFPDLSSVPPTPQNKIKKLLYNCFLMTHKLKP